MAITVAEALQAGRDKLGVKSGDPEFSPAKLLDALNDTLGELHQDLQGINADLLEVSATLTADSTESRVFSLASQAPPILNVFAPRQLTLLAHLAAPKHLEGVGVVRPVDDPQVLTAAHLQPGLRPPLSAWIGLTTTPSPPPAVSSSHQFAAAARSAAEERST